MPNHTITQHKESAINSLVHRAFIISDKEHLQTELNHLKLVLQKNGHNKKDITKIINKHARQRSLTHNQTKGSYSFSHVSKKQLAGY